MNTTIGAVMAACLFVGATGCGAADGYYEESVAAESQALVGNVSIGSFNNGKWYYDTNNDGIFNGSDPVLPAAGTFGVAGDIPLLGWGGGHTCGVAAGNIGVYRPSTGEYFFDMNGNRVWDGTPTDRYMTFASGFLDGPTRGFPFIWTRKVGTTCQGLVGFGFRVGVTGSDWLWLVDLNNNGIYDGGVEDLGIFGGGGTAERPVPIWSAAQSSSVMAIFNGTNGAWYVDTNNNKQFDGCAIDACTNFGANGDYPIMSSGTAIRGVTRPGNTRFIDGNKNGWWDGAPADGAYAWRTGDVWGFIWAGG